MHRSTARAVLLLTGALAACGTDPLGPDFEQRLTHQGACADVIFFAVDEADRLMLTFRAEGLVEEARNLGEEIVRTFEFRTSDFPAFAAHLVVERGSRVSDATCDDVIEDGGPQVDRTWSAVDGRATVTIRPGLIEFSARGDLVLEDVVVEDGNGNRARIERMEWANMSVGWFPG